MASLLLAGAWVALGLGCGIGSSHPSEVNDTQIIAAVVEPAEPAPGETVFAEVFVADPKDRGVELLAWSCTPSGDEPCVERLGGVAAMVTVVDEPVDGSFFVVRQIPSDAAALAAQAGVDPDELAALVYLLACEPGVCPVLQQARDALANPQDDAASLALATVLSDPEPWMRDLPLYGVNLAVRLVPLSSGGNRNGNPSADQRFRDPEDEGTPLVVSSGDAIDLRFSVFDPDGKRVDAYGYTTLGRFDDDRVREDRENDAVVHWLLAPDEPGTGRVWVVFDDRDGGRAVWTQALEVR